MMRFQFNRNSMLIGVAVLAIIVTGVLLFINSSFSNLVPMTNPFGMSKQSVANKTIDYLNKNLITEGKTATLGQVFEESGVIKIQVNVDGNTYTSYVTKDGKLFFVEGINLNEKPKDQAAAQ